ncbi:MAG: SdrD B-like domain-containing protein [Patescibacteria group bacterium]
MNANHYNSNPKKRGKFYRVVNIIVMTAFLFNMTATQGLLMLSPAQAQATQDKYTLCHATGSDTNPWVRIHVPESALPAHLDGNGTPLAGHEDDVYLGLDNADLLQCPTPPVSCPNVFGDNFESYSVGTIPLPWSQNYGVTIEDINGTHEKIAKMNSSESHDEERMWTTIDTSGRTNLKLRYDQKTDGLERNEQDVFTLKYKINSESSWNVLYQTDVNDSWDHMVFNLPNANQITISFGLLGTNENDKAFVDNVTLSGCVANVCGDETVGGDEECDDGNVNDGDGCSATCTIETCTDTDNDTICDDIDNCPSIPNPSQNDADADGVGDACDMCAGADDALDNEGDGIPNGCDNCPWEPNWDQTDTDNDGVGDACDEPVCGDGNLDEPQEECDDGNGENGDGCSAQCTLTYNIQGQKWNDEDNDSYWDDNESPLAGVEITLDGGNSGTVYTNANGEYEFSGLLPNNYTVCEVVQDGWEQSLPGTGSGDCYEITLPDDGQTTYNFGNHQIDNVTIVAYKIVCTEESDLPNWGNGGENITAATAQNWVDSHDSCEFESDWNFQWRVDSGNPYNPGDNTGESVGTDWTTFGLTDGNGMTSTEIDFDLADKFWFREVMQPGYIPFTYNVAGNNSNNVSAEFYCSSDVLNYDNLEWIDNMTPGETYHCVAWNVQAQPTKGDLTICKYNDVDSDGEYSDLIDTPLQWEMNVEAMSGVADGSIWGTGTNSETGCVTLADMWLGEYRVTETAVDGWSPTNPVSGDQSIELTAENPDQTVRFLNEQVYDLHGYKWNDLDGDRYPDCNPVKGAELTTAATPPLDCEPRLSGWTIFIDENENGILDGEEQSTITSDDPEHLGWYWFEDLPAGDYRVCEVQQSDWAQTYPQTADGCHTVTLPTMTEGDTCISEYALNGVDNAPSICNFGNIHDKGDLTIVKYDDDENLMAEVEFQIDGETYWTNGNGEIVLEDILTGYHIVEEMGMDNYTFTSVTGDNCTNSNPSAANVVEDGTTCTFTNTRNTGDVSGMKYEDLNGNGIRDCAIPAKSLGIINVNDSEDPEVCEPALPGWTINLAFNACSENSSDYDLSNDGELDLSDVAMMAQYLETPNNPQGDMNDDGLTNQADFNCFSAIYTDSSLPAIADKSDVTDEDGTYSFKGLTPGSYNVWETLDNNPGDAHGGWIQTSTPVVHTVLIGAGDEITGEDQNFGNQYVGYCGDEVVNNGEECDYNSSYGVPENYHCTQECQLQEDPYYLVDGYKYEDLDGNGTWNEAYEQPLNGWEICYAYEPLDRVEDIAFSFDSFALGIMEDTDNCVMTGSGEEWPDGYYQFKFYNPGHVTLTETPQPGSGYTQTEPVAGAPWEIEMAENPELPQYNFGNQPDFSVNIEKSASVTTIGQAEQFGYTINWGLTGIITADQVIITDTLPADVSFVSATDSGIYDSGTHTVAWTLNNIAPGTTGSFGVTVQALSNVTNGEELLNTVDILGTKYLEAPAEASALAGPVLTRIDRSDTANATVTVVVPDVAAPLLQITKDASVATADAGDTVTYTVVVTNVGSAKAVNVMVDDTLPAGMTFVDGGGTTVALVLGDIEIGQSKTTTYDVKIADNATSGSYENLAVASADNHDDISDSAIVEVENPVVLGETTEAELALIKTADVEYTNPAGTVEYTLTVTNNGTEDAQNVVLTDQLPDGFVFEGTTDVVKVWNFSTIAVGAAETVTYKATVNANTTAGMYENVALAKADNSDDAGASAIVEVRAVSVLGALVDTGTTTRDYLLYIGGVMLVISGIWFFTREKNLSHHSK